MGRLNKNKRGEVVLSRNMSLLVMFLWGLIMFGLAIYAMSKLGWIGQEETSTIYCSDGTIEIFNGSGIYCGIYVESIEQLEKEITSTSLNYNNGMEQIQT